MAANRSLSPINHHPAEKRDNSDRREPAPVCNYEGSGYRTDFWEGRGRDYEDAVERIAIRRLLPESGDRLLEIGAGFGRLTDLYSNYRQIVLLDYSRTLLREAQARLGRSDHYLYVAGDTYNLPFVPGTFDAATLVRVIHHLVDVPAALDQIVAVLRPAAPFILEYANKRNWKAIARYLLHRQKWNPFDPMPHEFLTLNFDFHPDWIHCRLVEAGFNIDRIFTVSHYRHPQLKRLVPLPILVAADALVQPTGGLVQLSPSVFVRAMAPAGNRLAPPEELFRCPNCGHSPLLPAQEALDCPSCGRRWAIRDGLYDFKEPFTTG